jgi:hypothetical protein
MNRAAEFARGSEPCWRVGVFDTRSQMMSDTKEPAKNKPADIEHPQPAVHSDNEKSKLPERDDEGRNQSPADSPGKKPGEGEPSVG